MRRMELFTHPTVEQLHQLGLAGMTRTFAELEANPTSAALVGLASSSTKARAMPASPS